MEDILRIQLPINGAPPFRKIEMRQTDSGRVLAITITNGAVAMDIPDGTVAEFNARNPDNQIITRTDGVNVAGSMVTVQITPNVLAVPGEVLCEIVLTGTNGVQIGTVVFVLAVWKAVVAAQDIGDLPDYQAVQTARIAAEAARDEAEKSAILATEAAQRAEEIEQNPVRVGDNGNLWNWDSSTETWVDSGISAVGGGDMNRDVYDPQNKEKDVFLWEDEAMLKNDYAPEAITETNGDNVSITSVYSHPRTVYKIDFIAEVDCPVNPAVSIDGTTIILLDSDGNPYIREAWKAGDYVQIHRNGSEARVLSPLANKLDTDYFVSESAIILYCSTDGDDITGNGSEASPFRTVQKALSELPIHSSFPRRIVLSEGYYSAAGDVDIMGFSGEDVVIKGADNLSDSTKYVFNGISVKGCAATIRLSGIQAIRAEADAGAIVADGAVSVYCDNCTVYHPSAISRSFGYYVTRGANLHLYNARALNVARACVAHSGGRIILDGMTVSNASEFGLTSYYGGEIALASAVSFSGTTSQYRVTNGGKIVMPSGATLGT